MNYDRFNQGDTVRYTGTALSRKYPELMKRDRIGEVICRVEGEEECYVVSFGDDFICHASNLTKHNFKDKSSDGPDLEIEKLIKRLDQQSNSDK